MADLKEENSLFARGYKLVAGVDEAGRGPLAGPVVAACVVCNSQIAVDKELLETINDSKKLSQKIREEVFEIIIKNFTFGIGICDHETIDRINILQATFLAMKKAISDLKEKSDYLLVDGKFSIPNCSYPQEAIIKGDEKVFSIMAASIIAKVSRDRMMLAFHKEYPQYGFDLHKGYGTKLHLEQIKKHGPCAIHRKSFGPCKI